jgi:hypothetical protein
VPTTARKAGGLVKRILADIDRLLQPGFDPLTAANLAFTLAATDYALRAVIVPFIAAPCNPHIRCGAASRASSPLDKKIDLNADTAHHAMNSTAAL